MRRYTCALTRVKIDGGLGGSTPLEQWSTLPGKVPKWGWGSVLDNFQLNNSLTHSNFRYFTFSGKNVKIRPPWKNLTLPGKKFNFYPGPDIFDEIVGEQMQFKPTTHAVCFHMQAEYKICPHTFNTCAGSGKWYIVGHCRRFNKFHMLAHVENSRICQA